MQHTPLGVIVIVALSVAATASFDHHQKSERRYQLARQEYERSKSAVTPDASAYRPYTGDKTYREEWRAEQDLEAQREVARTSWWLMIATFAGIVLLGGTLYETNRTAVAVRDSLHEAKEANNVAREQLEVSHRPWIKVEARIAGPFAFVRDGTGRIQANIRVEFMVTNFGNAAATELLIYSKTSAMPVDGSFDLRSQFREHVANRANGPKVGHIVVPNDSRVSKADIPIWPWEIDLALATYHWPGGEKAIAPSILACCVYNDPRTGKTYETGMIFDVSRHANPGFFEVVLGEIPARALRVSESIVCSYIT